jgi:hypothetical protein
MNLFIVRNGNHVAIVSCDGEREQAKRIAIKFLLGDPENYIVTPLTKKNDVLYFSFTAGVLGQPQ